MTIRQQLAAMFADVSREELSAHTELLEQSRGAFAYELGGQPVQVSVSNALAVARLVRKIRRKHEIQVAADLRSFAADGHEPSLNSHGYRDLSNWVGVLTPAWYTVFSYSSPDPRSPWFCSLDLEAQRLVLLLVAEILETTK